MVIDRAEKADSNLTLNQQRTRPLQVLHNLPIVRRIV